MKDNTKALEEIASKITALCKAEGELQDSLAATRASIRTLRLESCLLQHGVTIGSVVRNNKGEEFRVTKIDTSWATPWLMGNPRRKDGEWGTAERHLYSKWTAVTN